jgi:hypothetical protein
MQMAQRVVSTRPAGLWVAKERMLSTSIVSSASVSSRSAPRQRPEYPLIQNWNYLAVIKVQIQASRYEHEREQDRRGYFCIGSTPAIEKPKPNFRQAWKAAICSRRLNDASAPLAEVEGLTALLVSSTATDRLDDLAD